jgi:hypothetical protein
MVNHFGINSGFMLFQALNCLLPLIWLGLSIAALYGLKKRTLNQTALALWAILISFLPVLGAIAFWIISPNNPEQDGAG